MCSTIEKIFKLILDIKSNMVTNDDLMVMETTLLGGQLASIHKIDMSLADLIAVQSDVKLDQLLRVML